MILQLYYEDNYSLFIIKSFFYKKNIFFDFADKIGR